jgi:hypothetical protein
VKKLGRDKPSRFILDTVSDCRWQKVAVYAQQCKLRDISGYGNRAGSGSLLAPASNRRDRIRISAQARQLRGVGPSVLLLLHLAIPSAALQSTVVCAEARIQRRQRTTIAIALLSLMVECIMSTLEFLNTHVINANTPCGTRHFQELAVLVRTTPYYNNMGRRWSFLTCKGSFRVAIAVVAQAN